MTTDFTLLDFLAWARTKPEGEEYCFIDSTACALAQFGIATRRAVLVGSGGSRVLCEWPDLCEAVNPTGRSLKMGLPLDFTFGALVKRLEALCPSDTWTKVESYLTDIEQVGA